MTKITKFMLRSVIFIIGAMVLAGVLTVGTLLIMDYVPLNPSLAQQPTFDIPVNMDQTLVEEDVDVITVPNNPTVHSHDVVPKNVKSKTIHSLFLPKDRTVYLFGQVSGNALVIAEQIQALNMISSAPIYILINSPGGSVLSGSILISAMQTSKAKITTICSGMCASMGAMIFEYGAERLMVDRSLIMFHPATVQYEGDVDRIFSFIKTIKLYTNKLEVDVAKRVGLTFDKYKQTISTEWWLDSEDALSANVCDRLVYLSTNLKFTSSNVTEENSKANKNVYDFYWINPEAQKIFNGMVGQ